MARPAPLLHWASSQFYEFTLSKEDRLLTCSSKEKPDEVVRLKNFISPIGEVIVEIWPWYTVASYANGSPYIEKQISIVVNGEPKFTRHFGFYSNNRTNGIDMERCKTTVNVRVQNEIDNYLSKSKLMTLDDNQRVLYKYCVSCWKVARQL